MYKRLFIAIKINPTEKLLRRIYSLRSMLSHEKINWIKEDHFHLTLKFLGKTHVDQIEDIAKGLKLISNNTQSFDLKLGPLGVFGSSYNPKVLWLSTNQEDLLKDLHHQIIEHLSTFGCNGDRQNFVPHISLARIKKLKEKSLFQQALQANDLEDVQSEHVKELLLIESVLSTKGAEYSIIERFKLGS